MTAREHWCVWRAMVVVALWLLPLAAVLAAPPQPQAPLDVSVSATGVTVAAVTPGARVVVFCVAQEPHRFSATLHKTTVIVADDQRSGRVTWQPAAGGLPRSVIVAAVELESGRSGIAAPPEYRLLELAGGGAIGRGTAGEMSRLETRGDFFEVMMVRPGEGAWTMTCGDGGRNDRDGRGNRRVSIEPDEMQPVNGSNAAAPKQFRPGDVVVAVETRQMAYFVSGVKQ